jgi:hypothetical protein
MTHSTPTLIELRRHYETVIAQSQSQAAQAKEQLAHIDALLVNGILQAQELPLLETTIAPTLKPASSIPALSAQSEAPDDRTEIEPDEDAKDFLARAKPSREAKAIPVPEVTAPGNRIPRPLLPAYQGLKRLEAIAQVLQDNPGQEMTTDSVILALFGNLSPEDRKAEKKKLKTLLYQGGKQKLWQKGRTPSSYIAGKPKTSEETPSAPVAAKASTAEAKAPAAKPKTAAISGGRDSISLLPAYAGLNKLEAIAQVLTEQSGHVLHQDTIFQLLYGEVGPDVLSEESKRMRASLFQGVGRGLWKKASNQPSSYIANATNGRKAKAAAGKNADAIAVPIAKAPAKLGRKPSESTGAKADSRGDRSTPPKTASRGRTQVLSLPAQYAGLSKIETVAKVLQENNGTAMHMDEIIEQLYGKLSGDDLKAEKVRMKDVMTRGVRRKLWNKAPGVPSSIVAGEPNQPSAKDKKAPATAKVARLEPATSKKPRKAASAKTAAKPKRKQAEVVALLKKANIKV